MPTQLELLQEADRRGLLSGDKKELFDEAVKRGLIRNDMQQIQEKMDPLKLRQDFMKNYGRTMLEGGGLAGGSIVGELATGGNPVGGIAGGAIGYGFGKQTADIIDEWLGNKQPESAPQKMLTAGKDVLEGAELETIGRGAGAAIGLAGQAGRQVWGKLTGTGYATIEQALAGSTKFRNALRGKISESEIINSFHDALNQLKLGRASIYQKELEGLSANQQAIDLAPIKEKTNQLLSKFVRIDPKTGNADWSRSALGSENSEGVKKIKEIIQTIEQWGSKEGDNTPVGLDMLKRQLDDFYSESSNARAFVSKIRNVVKDTLVESVPQYEKMTKKYAEATTLIKDVESGLMMRKEGISGRITADKTLRRLTLAMREDPELRRDLINIMGYASGQDLAGMLAGHSMSKWTPRGISGSGVGMAGQAAIALFVSPKYWPILIASSPRISAEFLIQFGNGLRSMPGMSPTAAKMLTYWMGNTIKENKVVRGGE